MSAPPTQWTADDTRTVLHDLARRTAAGETGAANTARAIVPLVAAECCPNVLRLFFNRLVPAVREGRANLANVALDELLGAEAS